MSSSLAANLAAPVNLYEPTVRVARRLGGVGIGPNATAGGDATATVVDAAAVLVVVAGAAAVLVDAAVVFVVVPSL